MLMGVRKLLVNPMEDIQEEANAALGSISGVN